MAEPPLIFISYSHSDERSKKQLLPHIRMLEQLGTLKMWDDRQIGGGDAWFEEIIEKLNRCTVAILLVSADFLASKFCMREEVPPLLERRQRDGMLIVPILIQPCLWHEVAWLRAIQLLPRDGIAIAELAKPKRNRVFTEVAGAISTFLKEGQDQALERMEVAWPAPEAVDIDRLPTSGYDLVGRNDELKLLNDTWDQGKINVVSLVAWGGVGKSTLVNKWCEYLEAENFRGAKRVFGWSFFSQGANKPAASAEDLIAAALEFFGDPDPSAGSPWTKGERLADLVRRDKTLLILDGLEPLQDPYQGIKDPSVQRLVEELARDNAGLCVITTREPVKELADLPDEALELNLEQISPEAGRALLRIKGLRGADAELEQASRDFGNHALAINLLASYLRDVEDHHVRHASEIPDLDIPDDEGRHPRRVMEAFARRFGDGPALDLLHVLGLFDRPASGGCIDALKASAIPGLTEHLAQLPEADWLRLLDDLRDLGLIAPESHHAPDELDAHPLVREHFGSRLKAERLEVWRAGHGRLYEHLRDSAEQFPDTLAEMTLLFQAMHHGCEAGRHQDALNEVYAPRIRRWGENYQIKTLGAFGADLTALAGLFDSPFEKPNADLKEWLQAFILNQAGFDLSSLGRLRQAVSPMRAGLDRADALERRADAATACESLADLLLKLGDVAEAVAIAQRGIAYAERSDVAFKRVSSRATLACALHQAGEFERAQMLFKEAEMLQVKFQPAYQILYSSSGYYYCDLLLTLKRSPEALERAIQILEWARVSAGVSLLDQALIYLALGRAALAAREHDYARAQLGQAVDALRKSGQIDDLPGGLLARAALFRETRHFGGAWRDLDEAMRIAERAEMRLFQCDADLEYARLALAEGNREQAREHVAEARRLVDETGYGRRRPEVEALEAKVR